MTRTLLWVGFGIAALSVIGCGTETSDSTGLASEQTPASTSSNVHADGIVSIADFKKLLEPDDKAAQSVFEAIQANWRPGYAPMLIEIWRGIRYQPRGISIIRTLKAGTGKSFGDELPDWYRWIWNEPYEPHPDYAEFKSWISAKTDPRFSEYFQHTETATIRLDEILWGGVKRDGIPPLKNPKMIAAAEADYLDDSNVVFGIRFGDDARAYPKRILAWHEMFKDTIDGKSYCGVY